MNEKHEANRAVWNAMSDRWQQGIHERGEWNKCHRQPELALSPVELSTLRDMAGRDGCVLGSGDNLVVFALAGLGANVTSVDISDRQLAIAEERAGTLGLDITFLRADVTDLSALAHGRFDFVYTGGHVDVWVSDIRRYYAEGIRILKPGGLFIVNEYHPFRRIWLEKSEELTLQYPYLIRGPFEYQSDDGLPQFEYHWTVADHVQAILDQGCELLEIDEYGAGEESWQEAHMSGLPQYLFIVGRKKMDG